MENILSLSLMRWMRRLAMVLTLGACGYVFLFLSNRQDVAEDNADTPSKTAAVIVPVGSEDVKPRAVLTDAQARDIFSSAASLPSGAVENTQRGQLPAHLKVVGIVVGHPSQIIIEDSFVNKTYFIHEGDSQAGMRITRVGKGQMTINYQGQDILLPIVKN